MNDLDMSDRPDREQDTALTRKPSGDRTLPPDRATRPTRRRPAGEAGIGVLDVLARGRARSSKKLRRFDENSVTVESGSIPLRPTKAPENGNGFRFAETLAPRL